MIRTNTPIDYQKKLYGRFSYCFFVWIIFVVVDVKRSARKLRCRLNENKWINSANIATSLRVSRDSQWNYICSNIHMEMVNSGIWRKYRKTQFELLKRFLCILTNMDKETAVKMVKLHENLNILLEKPH